MVKKKSNRKVRQVLASPQPATLKLDVPGLAQQIGRLRQFTNPDSTRYVMADVDGFVSGGLLSLRATDGHRAIQFTTTNTQFTDGEFRIPHKLLRRMENLPTSADRIKLTASLTEATLNWCKNRHRLSTEEQSITEAAADARFPDISKSVPDPEYYRSNGCAVWQGSCEEWLRSLPDPDRLVCTWEGGADNFTYFREMGCGVELVTEANRPCSVMLNTQLLRQFIAYVDGDVTVYIPSDGEPIYAESTLGPNKFNYWLMPCRLP